MLLVRNILRSHVRLGHDPDDHALLTRHLLNVQIHAGVTNPKEEE
jgi:hypothetical protein